MKRTYIEKEREALLATFPSVLRAWIGDAKLYDSSCSPEARVYFVDRDGGCFLKTSEKGSLKTEAELTRYFHGKGLAAEVLFYESGDHDYLLTSRVSGEDCTDALYLAEPKKLARTLAEVLRNLHALDASDCPVVRSESYIASVEEGYRHGRFDRSIFLPGMTLSDRESEYAFFCAHKHLLAKDTLIHGDACLPNIMLDSWRWSGLIDLGNGGRADRHIDLFWGAWTLLYNLKTDAYRQYFFDAYGCEFLDDERLRLVAAAECFG